MASFYFFLFRKITPTYFTFFAILFYSFCCFWFFFQISFIFSLFYDFFRLIFFLMYRFFSFKIIRMWNRLPAKLKLKSSLLQCFSKTPINLRSNVVNFWTLCVNTWTNNKPNPKCHLSKQFSKDLLTWCQIIIQETQTGPLWWWRRCLLLCHQL